MPSGKNYVRNYQQEYAVESLKRRKQRAERNQARRMVVKRKGKIPAGKDVGHKLALSKGGANTAANLFLQSARTNRSFSRRSDGSMKSERSKHGE